MTLHCAVARHVIELRCRNHFDQSRCNPHHHRCVQASDALKPAADTVAEQAMPTAKKFTDGQLKPAADKLAKNAVPTAKQVDCAELLLSLCTLAKQTALCKLSGTVMCLLVKRSPSRTRSQTTFLRACALPVLLVARRQ